MAASSTSSTPSETLAAKLQHLFATVKPAGRGEYSNHEVATAIEAGGGPTISATYIWQLRKGLRSNPTLNHLEALAGFFGVPVAYFLDEEITDRIDEELEVIAALRDAGIRSVALRAAHAVRSGGSGRASACRAAPAPGSRAHP